MNIWIVSKEVQLEGVFEPTKGPREIGSTTDMKEKFGFLSKRLKKKIIRRSGLRYSSRSRRYEKRMIGLFEYLVQKGLSVLWGECMSMLEYQLSMVFGPIAFVLVKSSFGVRMSKSNHRTISYHLGCDTRRRDQRYFLISFDDSLYTTSQQFIKSKGMITVYQQSPKNKKRLRLVDTNFDKRNESLTVILSPISKILRKNK